LIHENERNFQLTYDELVVAVGAINNTFGTPGVYENCNFLKEVQDAITIRKKVIDCFETASLPGTSPTEIKRLLNFVVVGGGPNGVEFAAELRDFVDQNLKNRFPALVPYVKITLLELLDHILSTYDAKISEYTEKHFRKTNIDVKTRYQVLSVTDKNVVTKRLADNQQEEIPFGLCVWSTGIGPSPFVEVLRTKFPQQQTNRRAVLTESSLKVKGTTNIWALGDCATIEQPRLLSKFDQLFKDADVENIGYLRLYEFTKLVEQNKKKYPQLELYGKKIEEVFHEADLNKDNLLSLDEFKQAVTRVDSKLKMLPATAQVASQQGEYIARIFNNVKTTASAPEARPFVYHHFGSFAYIGDDNAIYEYPNHFVFSGFAAWWLWRSVYWSKQVSFRNKCLVAFDWTKAALFGRDITRN